MLNRTQVVGGASNEEDPVVIMLGDPRCASTGKLKVSPERVFCIENLLVRIHLIIEMLLVDRPCAMGV